jgi:mono/diheme cytochrome c family protein
MRVRSVVLCVLSVMLLAFAIGCAKQEPPKTAAPAAPAAPAAAAPAAGGAADGKALFEQKCSVCHGLDRATVRAETREKWASIIKDMQAKKADWISDADAAKILDYLVKEHGKK